jgi:hypothetical protein
MDFLYLQRGLESRPCREILYIMCTHIYACTVLCVLYVNSTFTLYFQYFFRYVLPPVLFTLTQVVLLLITSTFTFTFTRVQIQSNLGTTVVMLDQQGMADLLSLSKNNFDQNL